MRRAKGQPDAPPSAKEGGAKAAAGAGKGAKAAPKDKGGKDKDKEVVKKGAGGGRKVR